MSDAKITALTENTTPISTDILPMVDDPGGTPATQKISIANFYKTLYPPEGFLLNGKIVPSVASNNLTVAIKGMDGNDPSATNPVFVRIGSTIRSITTALSVTKNAATNWCNAGGSELATKEIDYFTYIGYNATDGVVIGFSRISYANLYSDFSATSTNEKYCAISTITNAAAGDDYGVIGRFAATLSAGAGYTWSVPTFTSANLVQRPVYQTRWLDWAPVIVGFSANPTSATYKYQMIGNVIFLVTFQGTAGTSDATNFTETIPFSVVATTGGAMNLAVDNGTNLTGATRISVVGGGNSAVLATNMATGAWTNTGNKRANWQLFAII